MWALCRDSLPDQHLQPCCDAVKRVALRHPRSVPDDSVAVSAGASKRNDLRVGVAYPGAAERVGNRGELVARQRTTE